MSLIQFRGRAILPPLLIEKRQESLDEDFDVRCKEEETLLSMPPSEALKFILCGVPELSYDESKETVKELNGSKNLANERVKGVNSSTIFELKCSEDITKRTENISAQPTKSDLLSNKEKTMTIVENIVKGNIDNINITDFTATIRERNESLNDTLDLLLSESDSNITVELIEENLASKEVKANETHSFRDSKNTRQEREETLESHFFEEEKSKSMSNTENLLSLSSTNSTMNKNLVSGVTHHQKLKVLKSSGTDSSSYLQDYLQLLTSRSHFPNVGKLKKENETTLDPVLERSGSAPSLLAKKTSTSNVRQRNSSGSSDKSTPRSLGSTYLDSYLGNLTDHSWIIYPTEPISSPSLKLDAFDKTAKDSLTASPSSKNGEYMHRRLHFINPEKFFNATSDKIESLEDAYQPTSLLKSSSSAENDHDLGLTDTSGIVISPDISSSSLDTDKLDTSHPLSTSLQETPELKDCHSNQDYSQHTPNNVESQDSSKLCVLDNVSSDNKIVSIEKQNDVLHSEASTLKVNFTFERDTSVGEVCVSLKGMDSEVFKDKSDLHVQSVLQGLESQEETLLSNSEESSVTSTDDAEDQISMIVCDTQKSLEVNTNNECTKENLSDRSKSYPSKSKTVDSALASNISKNSKNLSSTDEIGLSQKSSDNVEMLTDFSGVDSSVSKLINMLKAKQEEELQELKKKHEQEMNNFIYELSQLSPSERLALANAYDSLNNNSLNEILGEMNNPPGNASQPCGSSTEISTSNDADTHKEPYTSPFNHTNLTPSFFLHGENQENGNEKRNISKISQIFSPSRISSHNVAERNFVQLLTFHSNILQNNLGEAARSDSEIGNAISKENTENKSDIRKSLMFSQRQFEVGLDLVPTRESDGATLSSVVMNAKPGRGISKLQAIIKGRRIRRLMKTTQIQQLLATLKEVAKLAHQFHQDILMDNIRKGDIDFHKALFNQEQQTREKLIDTMVEMTPSDQIRLIQRDRISEQRGNQRRLSDQPKPSPSSHIPKTKFLPHSASSLLETSNKNLSSTKSGMSAQKGEIIKQTSRKTFSELPRPCKTTQPSESRSLRCPSTSPRGRQALIPAHKSLVPKGIPKQRILKKIEPNPQPHVSLKRHNAPICKSDSGYLSNFSARTSKSDRNGLSLRGDLIPSRKRWR